MVLIQSSSLDITLEAYEFNFECVYKSLYECIIYKLYMKGHLI